MNIWIWVYGEKNVTIYPNPMNYVNKNALWMHVLGIYMYKSFLIPNIY